MNLPESFTNRIKTQLGDEYEAYMNCLDQGMHHGLRVNTNKISVEDFLKISPFELKPVPWTTNGFYYDDKACTPSKHPYYYAGLYYIQEPSAMAPASILPVEDGDVVLDICAAPGGKSTELAAKLHGTGFLISNDISNSRAKALLKNLELFGIGNMCVDAPCSGEGMFRKSQSMVTAWENNGVELFAGLQRGILNEVVKMLKPGGTMLYSTCTFSPEENEQSIEYLLSLDDTLELIEVPKYPGFCNGNPAWGKTENAELEKCARLWPHHIEGEGHFVALIHKKEAEQTQVFQSWIHRGCKPDKNAEEFFTHISADAGIKSAYIEENNGRLYYMAECMPDVSGLRMLRQGLFLGEIKKNRFEPSQSLAMYLRQGQFDNEVNLTSSDDRVFRYLKGETIEASDQKIKNGYVLVLVDGYPLGWAKNTNGTLKNKYLSGWRMMS